MNHWKVAHPSDTWPPQDSNGAVNNVLPSLPSLQGQRLYTGNGCVYYQHLHHGGDGQCLDCRTANAASTGKVIDVNAPSNAIIVTPPNKRSSGSDLDSLVQAGPKAKKPKDNLLYSCFIVTPSVGEGLEGKVDACCKYCSIFQQGSADV